MTANGLENSTDAAPPPQLHNLDGLDQIFRLSAIDYGLGQHCLAFEISDSMPSMKLLVSIDELSAPPSPQPEVASPSLILEISKPTTP